MVEEAMQGRNTLERVERSATSEFNISSYPGVATLTALIKLSVEEGLYLLHITQRNHCAIGGFQCGGSMLRYSGTPAEQVVIEALSCRHTSSMTNAVVAHAASGFISALAKAPGKS